MKKTAGCASCKGTPVTEKEHTKKMLLNYFPILENEFRELKESELENEDVFNELFNGENLDFGKLKAIYHYQQLSKSNN